MSYQLEEQYTSKNQVAGADANSVWKLGPRRVSSITIHHWGEKGQQFDTVRDFLCTNDKPTSAHYVAEDGRVACIVSPDDCAFHTGVAEGNTNSIGIECRPEATDGDYATVAELIRFLRGLYGDIPLHPHSYWFNTACPGDYDLARLDSLARGIAAQGTITPTEGFLMALTDDEQRRILSAADMVLDTPGRAAGPRVLNTNDGAYIVGLVGRDANPGAVADAVIAQVGKGLAAEVVTALGQKLGAK